MRKDEVEELLKQFDVEDRIDLKRLHDHLERDQARVGSPNTPIGNLPLKKRVARICLKLMDETFRDEQSIQKTSYLLAGNFLWYSYGDEMDVLMGVFGDLELPSSQVDGDVFRMWDDLKVGLKNYISKH